ncbi:MAG TPA: TMEM175 family protein [Pyrinomonadaceae bacterium]|nr:TMEM175 family protein [Pyrinomonadaceae bacterium]
MNTSRLEAFSDGVIAILITIMVLELRVPHGDNFTALEPLFPIFLTYVLSFVNLGIYWNNHHHMLQATEHIDGRILWANLNLLFWLSLMPFTTGWMGENHFSSLPTAIYGIDLILAALSYLLLQTLIVRYNGGENTKLKEAVGNDLKGKLSLVIYAVAIGLAFVNNLISLGLYVLVAAVWLVPDRRIEREVHSGHSSEK